MGARCANQMGESKQWRSAHGSLIRRSRRMVTKAGRMAAGANLPLWSWPGKFANVYLPGTENYREVDRLGLGKPPLDRYLERPPMDDPIALYDFSRRGGDVPVFAGEALRPPATTTTTPRPPSEACDRSMRRHLRPWRMAADSRASAEDPWSPISHGFLLSDGCHLSIKAGVARAKARRAKPVGCSWEGPTQNGVFPPSDSDEEDPRISARDPGGADLDDSSIADFRDYGEAFDWCTVYPSI